MPSRLVAVEWRVQERVPEFSVPVDCLRILVEVPEGECRAWIFEDPRYLNSRDPIAVWTDENCLRTPGFSNIGPWTHAESIDDAYGALQGWADSIMKDGGPFRD